MVKSIGIWCRFSSALYLAHVSLQHLCAVARAKLATNSVFKKFPAPDLGNASLTKNSL